MPDAQLAQPLTATDQPILYVLDTNVLIHDPTALLNFEEHHVMIPMTVLEELDKLKSGRKAQAADCRQAIREIDRILGRATPEEIAAGVPIPRASKDTYGRLSIIMSPPLPENVSTLPNHLNDNKIINDLCQLKHDFPHHRVVLVTKDINMRLKARGCGIESDDYQNDQLVSDIEQLNKGYIEIQGNFWDQVNKVDTEQQMGRTVHRIPLSDFNCEVHPNQFIIDELGFIGRVINTVDDEVHLLHIDSHSFMEQEAWGLTPQDVYQAMALNLLMDPDVHLVNLTGSAGSGKTILALAAAIEMTVATKQYRRIIATRSTQGLDEDIGFLPGTEAEKMEPWLGAITDNLEALHCDDEDCSGSIDYVLNKVPLHFKSLNYIRGRSFQHSLILIDESQNLTPHQIKTIVTRAGNGSKVICLGNLAQIDTPYLNATSSGLTYLTERFKDFQFGGNIKLQGVPRSLLAEYAEANL
ncbi:PhoH family protein [Pseudomaricurvus sp. HS19]|uniref:PhoH family protein n=1 Tax=Pseudomaricurvus sp. HS19 TaxID=2692626 RepID=UPI00136AA6E9|nr:PhoH family protein [Pseudomaricurvus sp. HS19]MYM62903.1 AAA family ATPase [Pseudomaricurvus sp. HS19]